MKKNLLFNETNVMGYQNSRNTQYSFINNALL